MTIRIRRYRKTDRAACARILCLAFAGPPWRERWPRKACLARMRELEPCARFVATEDGAVAGWAAYNVYVGSAGARTAYLRHLAVRPRSQRKGVATALIKAVERHARSRGIRFFEAQTAARGGPLRFYRALGFRRAPYPILLRKRL